MFTCFVLQVHKINVSDFPTVNRMKAAVSYYAVHNMHRLKITLHSSASVSSDFMALCKCCYYYYY